MRTSIARWENPISKTVIPAPKLPASQGKRIPCINACGNTVTEAAIICRHCKRKAKIKKGRAEEKTRKNK